MSQTQILNKIFQSLQNLDFNYHLMNYVNSMRNVSVFLSVFLWFFIFGNFLLADEYNLSKIKGKLYKPWGISFINEDEILITQKSGEILKIDISTQDSTNISHNLIVKEYGQGGLLDILYYQDHIYVTYAEKRNSNKYSTSIARGNFVSDNEINFTNIFQSEPPTEEDIHFGSRLSIKDNFLYATLGERKQGIATQDPNNHYGKIIRINLDGSIPSDNPDFNDPKTYPGVFQVGLRNPQGMALSPVDNEVYITNHGPKGGDFFGKVIREGNYGWDDVAWGGIDYDGSIIGDGSAWKPGYDKPIYRWIPSIAVSNIVFYQGKEFEYLNGNVLLASLKAQKLISLQYENGKIINEEILIEKKGRIRDVEVNKQGKIFIITDDANGGLWQLMKNE